MPVETALWRITEDGLAEARPSTLKREADLHKWLEADPKLLGDLLLIGSEVTTQFGGRIDLLALDPTGIVHVIELKRDRTPREVVAQALDYASWAATLTLDDLQDIYRRYKAEDLGSAFQARFGTLLPETLADEHRHLRDSTGDLQNIRHEDGRISKKRVRCFDRLAISY